MKLNKICTTQAQETQSCSWVGHRRSIQAGRYPARASFEANLSG
ncbi:MAG TPA: hypothetical protein VK152_05795 [Paludibacter sp.]|nr:hypothetical protein [Paludibacter sp.]